MTDTHALRWGVNGTKIRNNVAGAAWVVAGTDEKGTCLEITELCGQVPAAMLNTGHGWATTCRGHCVNLELTI